MAMIKMKDLNWNHLYYFYEVAKSRSLKSGAKSIGVASSTLSTQIKVLEKNLGVKLFIRSSKGLSLTSDGEDLFERSKIIFEEGSKLIEHYSEDSVGGYPITVGIEETITYDLSTEFISQYWDLYTAYGVVNTIRQPDSEVLLDNLLQGNIDWGISLRKPKRKGIGFKEIGSFEIVFCCSEELYNKFIDVKDILINIPLIESNWDEQLNDAILKYLRKNQVAPKERIFSDHVEYVQKLCQRGRCVTFLPKNPLGNYKGFKTFQLEKGRLSLSLFAVWKKEDEKLISIRTLNSLLQTKLSSVPSRYSDVELQIEVSDVADDLLE